MMRALLLPLLLALLGGCVSQTALSLDERKVLEQDLTGKDRDRFLRLSFYVTPFFGDSTKRLLTPVPPDEVRMLEYPDGTPVNPGAIEKVIPVGTRARITRVEFPTAWVMAERLIYTPRYEPWVYLQIEGESGPTPLVLVLRPKIKTQGEFLAELDRYLVDHDPLLSLAGLSQAARDAVREKRAMLDLTADALEMAWGYPEVKKVSYEGQVRREDWIYPGGARIAHLADGRVVALDGGKR